MRCLCSQQKDIVFLRLLAFRKCLKQNNERKECRDYLLDGMYMNVDTNNIKMTFCPSILVGEKDNCSNALTDKIHLEGLIMQKCSENSIFHCNAFMARTDAPESEICTKKFLKIQDKAFFHVFATVCQDERICKKDECCARDCRAAEFIFEHEMVSMDKYEELKEICPITDMDRTGIKYICNITGFYEIAFPVSLYERQMGVLIVGQIATPESKEKLVNQLMENYEKCSLDCQNPKIKDEGKCNIDRIAVDNNLEELIHKILKTVICIEKGLEECYQERQSRYVLEICSELVKHFKDDRAGIGKASDSLMLVYPAVADLELNKELLDLIRKYFGILCDLIGAKQREIFLLDSNDLANHDNDVIHSANFNLDVTKIKDEEIDNNQYCGHPSKCINGIDSKYDLLLISKVRNYPIAIAVSTNEFMPDGATEEEQSLLKWTFCEAFGRFAEYVQMAGLEAKSEYYRVHLDNYMSIMRHELGQSNAGYQMLIEQFKNFRKQYSSELSEMDISSSYYRKLCEFIKQCDTFISDSESYLAITKIRVQSTRYLMDFAVEKPEYFYPYEAFLFKWHQIYDKLAQEEDLIFDFPQVKSYDVNRPRMYGNSYMIEQATYNLTNNAIKYALRGTTVSLDCRLNEEHNRYEIIVENWGHSLKDMDNIERIFEYGVRGTNNVKEGSGLGLFLTRGIAKAHGGDVICEMKEVSEYDWSLLELYMQAYESKDIKFFCKNEALYLKLKAEWDSKSTQINECITKRNLGNVFKAMYVHQNICKGTAKYKFTFWVPYTGD